ncbi:leucine--tRNA ligase [bacterium]|nr:leucine--tRNA ligase [bacterium]
MNEQIGADSIGSSAGQGSQEAGRYNFTEIEARWQAVWDAEGAFTASDSDPRPRAYVLEMFPYPSGDMHMGHVRNYVQGDTVSRYLRMRGYNVLHPMGYDSFGLPAEQAAIDRGIYPGDWIKTCIERATAQLKRYGFSYDWSRMVVTSQPDYYKWTQWLFLKFYEMGLVYRTNFEVNWCEEHGVLANDEVHDGGCWRCGRTVSRRKLEQWCMRTTDYAEDLLAMLDELPGWNPAVATMQRNWIGRSEGTHIDFSVPAVDAKLRVFTTRVDTVFGVTFMAIAPDHPLAARMAEAGGTAAALADFAAETAREAAAYSHDEEKPKRGLRLGVDCINPFNGESVPVFATNYVVSDFGTGAVMGVPGHDVRDHAFARQYGLPIRQVIEAADGSAVDVEAAAFTDKGVCVNSGEFFNQPFAETKSNMDAWLAERGLGGAQVQFKLRDWNMSRQRFWGAPIPMVHCDKPAAEGGCGWQQVPLEQLPVVLPDKADYSDIRVSPLANDTAWQRSSCPACGGPATRETDTMTTFMDSAWYFLRYCDPHNSEAIFDPQKVAAWMPVDIYIGGKEHAVGHLLYSRFVCHVLKQAGVLNFARPDVLEGRGTIDREPFRRLHNQGIVYKDGAKMSKSKGNVVSADSLAESFGADTARLFEHFGGPYDQDLEWTAAGVQGCHRFLGRLWRLSLAVEHAGGPGGEPRDCDREALKARHRAVAGVSEDISAWRFNTAVAKLMEYLNALEGAWKQAGGTDSAGAFAEALRVFMQLLSPFSPHIAEELWERLGGTGLVCRSQWPQHDPAMLLSDTLELAVQVNGKVRGRITVPADADPAQCIAAAKAESAVAVWLEGKEIVKEICIPGRMVTLVVK